MTDNQTYLKTIISNLFPADEQDVFEYLMYYIAESVFAEIDTNYQLILTGNGSNGKTLISQLVSKSLTHAQYKKVDINYICDDMSRPNWDEKIKQQLITYSEPNKNINISSYHLDDEINHYNYRHHLIISNYNVSINNDHYDKLNLENTFTYKMKYTFTDNPTKPFEKLRIPNIMNDLEFLMDVRGEFLNLLEYYYNKFNNYKGDLLHTPCNFKPTIDKETKIWRDSLDI